jgi:hypothetical protein
MRLYRLISSAPGFDRLEITPQFSAMLSDLAASFATIDWCEQRICKLAPRDPQQLLQSVYGTEQFVWRCHSPVAFEIDEGNVLRRIILIRTIGETLRWYLVQPSPSGFRSPFRESIIQNFQGFSSLNSPNLQSRESSNPPKG